MFSTQLSNIGNAKEQLFHVRRTFHLIENAETIKAYVQRIMQVAAMLNYGKPQILEVFRNTLPPHLYGILFPTDILRQAVETGKRIHVMKKLDI